MREGALSKPVDIVVIGGGPAGLTAAGAAAGAGASVTLLEGGERMGRKLLLTGRGRCNVTCTLELPVFLDAYGPKGRFLRNAFSRFFSEDLLRFLAEIGVETARERGGRIYPSRGGARKVLEALQSHAVSSGATLLPGHRVRRLDRRPGGGFTASGRRFSLDAARAIVATGGASFPWTGSRGEGYRLARSLGHEITPLRPSLVPVRCSDPFLGRLTGLRLRNVCLSYRSGGRKRTFFGEVHFTDFGISGPAVFAASKEIGLLTEEGPLPLKVDLKPSLDDAALDGRLVREFAATGRQSVARIARRLLPRRLVPVFIEEAELSPGTTAAGMTRPARQRLRRLLKAFPLTATGTLPLERAMVTSGGVRLREIDPASMQSRLVSGLYFCGEVLDVDGTTGGFNLQAAFSTGHLAGLSASIPGHRRKGSG